MYLKCNKNQVKESSIDVLLNLIQKQQKEIKHLKFKNKVYKKKAKIDEKAIDEMAKYIENADYTEQLCEYCINSKKDCTKKECVEEIKQYFYRKVEGNE